jgi:hypothetical protein
MAAPLKVGILGAGGKPITPSDRSYMLYGIVGTIHSILVTRSEHEHFGEIMFAPMDERPIDRINPDDRHRLIRPSFEPIETSGTELPRLKPFVNEILHFEECSGPVGNPSAAAVTTSKR